MPFSMTGFGRASLDVPKMRLDVEIKSVNHRFLKLNVKIPRDLESLAPEVEETVRKRVVRGAVDLSVRIERKDDAAAYEFDAATLRHHLTALKSAGKKLKIPGAPDLALLAQLPGVFRPAENEALGSRESSKILATVDKAVDALLHARKAEGTRLARELESRCREIDGFVERVAARTPIVVDEYHRKLKDRVQKLLSDAGAGLKPEDLAREVAVMADRSDITEEIARLRSHVAQFNVVLKRTSGDVGRELDFLVQEMFRETNTMGSKAMDSAISHAVVAIKVELEKLREQVQNLE